MNFLRKIISGKKNRFEQDGLSLDLTYICPRIIAMSYPSEGFESVYRNHIDNVVSLLEKHHKNNYYVFNLSGRRYNYLKFDGRVFEYEWEDHHAPSLPLLFQICA